MNTLNDYLFKGGNRVDGDFGVEIELEGDILGTEAMLNYNNREWVVTQDGSLRGGAEFVSRGPVKYNSLDKHLKSLYNTLKELRVRYNISDRTGTHLHINVLDLTPQQIINFLASYYVVEEALVDLCGPNRVGNHFCLRAVDAEFVLLQLINSIEENYIGAVFTDDIRYSALNMKALQRHGSLEFRAIQSSEKFTDSVLPVADVLYALRENAKLIKNPRDIINRFSDNGVEAVLSMLLGGKKNVLTSVEGLNEKILRGIRLAQDIVYACDWDSKEFNWGMKQPRKKPMKRDTLIVLDEAAPHWLYNEEEGVF